MIVRNKLLALFFAAALAIGIALLLNSLRGGRPDGAVGNPVLPALAAGINDVSAVRITEAGNKPFVTLQRSADGKTWQVMERDGYRADMAKVREFLIKLADLQVVEIKTSNPANYPQIGVEDVDSATATGKRIDFEGLSAPLGLILGKSTLGTGNYVRVAGEEVSYLAKPQVTVYNEPEVWLDRSLPDLAASADVQEVRLALNEGKAAERSYTVTREAREQTDFTVPKLPAGRKLSPGGANANAGALAGLSFEDVRKRGADDSWQNAARAEFRLFDGRVITVFGRKEQNPDSQNSWDAEKHLVRFELAFDEAQHRRFLPKQDAPAKDAAEADATPQIANAGAAASDPGAVRQKLQDLRAQLDGWVFEIPAYKYSAIFRPLDELVAKD